MGMVLKEIPIELEERDLEISGIERMFQKKEVEIYANAGSASEDSTQKKHHKNCLHGDPDEST